MTGLPINYDRGKTKLTSGDDRKASPVFISTHKEKDGLSILFLVVYSKLSNHEGKDIELKFGNVKVKGIEEFKLIKDKIVQLRPKPKKEVKK